MTVGGYNQIPVKAQSSVLINTLTVIGLDKVIIDIVLLYIDILYILDILDIAALNHKLHYI